MKKKRKRKKSSDGMPLRELPTPRDLVRFFRKCVIDKETGCWNWKSYRNGKGYGQFWHAGRNHWASRWIKQVVSGAFPTGQQAHHEDICRNPSCVNPWHIRGLPVADNTADGNRNRKRKTDDDPIPF